MTQLTDDFSQILHHIERLLNLLTEFNLSVDGEDKIKLTNFIKYNSGLLSHSKENISFAASDVKYEEDSSEPFLITDYTFENITLDGEKVIISSVQDDKNYTSYFLYQKDRLLPVKTIVEGEVGILFMRWDIKSIALYHDFTLSL